MTKERAKRRVERIIEQSPCFNCFKPACKGKKNKETTEIYPDEYEALILCNLENLTMKQGAEKMGISAPTFNRTVNSVHKKITDAIVNGKIINIHCCEEKHKNNK